MRWANPNNTITYDDPGRRPSEHRVFTSGGDIYLALLGQCLVLVKENLVPTEQASFTISDEDMTDLLDIYFGDSRYIAFDVANGVPRFLGVRIKTPKQKPEGWWPKSE